MKMTRNNTVQTTTTVLSPMLMFALVLCEDPVVVSATMAKMRAGMEKARQMREEPQQSSVKMEKMRAQIAIPEWSLAGVDTTVVVVAAIGCVLTTTVAFVKVAVCGWHSL